MVHLRAGVIALAAASLGEGVAAASNRPLVEDTTDGDSSLTKEATDRLRRRLQKYNRRDGWNAGMKKCWYRKPSNDRWGKPSGKMMAKQGGWDGGYPHDDWTPPVPSVWGRPLRSNAKSGKSGKGRRELGAGGQPARSWSGASGPGCDEDELEACCNQGMTQRSFSERNEVCKDLGCHIRMCYEVEPNKKPTIREASHRPEWDWHWCPDKDPDPPSCDFPFPIMAQDPEYRPVNGSDFMFPAFNPYDLEEARMMFFGGDEMDNVPGAATNVATMDPRNIVPEGVLEGEGRTSFTGTAEIGGITYSGVARSEGFSSPTEGKGSSEFYGDVLYPNGDVSKGKSFAEGEFSIDGCTYNARGSTGFDGLVTLQDFGIEISGTSFAEGELVWKDGVLKKLQGQSRFSGTSKGATYEFSGDAFAEGSITNKPDGTFRSAGTAGFIGAGSFLFNGNEFDATGRSRAAGEIIIEPNGIQKYRGAASFNEFSADGFFILSASGDVIAIGGTTDGRCALEEDPQSCNDKDDCEWLSIFNEKNGMCLLMLPE